MSGALARAAAFFAWRRAGSAALVTGGLMATSAGCRPIVMPSPVRMLACEPVARGVAFRAGFARVDITTPPGPGLLGYGPEGNASRGYRQRIHARVLALEDARGERLVLAVADLDFISAALHRDIAGRVAACTGIGADRIVISATHTHSAPGHFAAHKPYDEQGTSVPGYDPAILDFFASRISIAILDALRGMQPARAAWDQRAVWGITRIRSFDAHLGDPHDWPSAWPRPATLPERFQHVDPTLTLLRIDTISRATGAATPAGAYGIFAVHGTAIPAANDLIDADLQGVAARVLERHIDEKNGLGPSFRPRAIAAFANSAEGDVLPPRDSLPWCDPPVLRRELRPGSWRSPPGAEAWLAGPGFDARRCVDDGIRAAEAAGTALGTAAAELFDALAGSLSDQLTLSRAFETVRLRGPEAIPGLCPEGHAGTATTVGAETGRSRLMGWKLGGFLAVGFENGGSAIRPGTSCQSPKNVPFGLLERAIAGPHGFEESAQFALLRIGDAYLATVPFEATTTVGARMREGIRRAVPAAGIVAIIGIANGYLNYVATEKEYAFQNYEGGSTLYGPRSAEVYTGRVAGLARELVRASPSSPPATVLPFPVYPSTPRRVMPVEAVDTTMTSRRVEDVVVDQAAATVRWTDWRPGALVPADAQLLSIERRQGSGWTAFAWDDDLAVEVRFVRHAGDRAAWWQARWAHECEQGTYRFVFPARGRLRAETSHEFNLPCSR